MLAGTSFESRASWEVAGALLGGNGKPFRLCGIGASHAPGGPAMTRLAQASWTPRQTLVAWALVDGRFASGASAAELDLTLEGWGATKTGPAPAPLQLRVTVPRDDLSGRLIELCFGTGCPRDSGLSQALGHLVASARVVGAAIRLRADRTSSGTDVWSPVRDDSRPSALELVVDRALQQKWAPLFDRLRSAEEHEAFRAELDSMGLQVPRLVLSGSAVRTAVAGTGPDWIAIGVDDAATHRAAFASARGPSPFVCAAGASSAGRAYGFLDRLLPGRAVCSPCPRRGPSTARGARNRRLPRGEWLAGARPGGPCADSPRRAGGAWSPLRRARNRRGGAPPRPRVG